MFFLVTHFQARPTTMANGLSTDPVTVSKTSPAIGNLDRREAFLATAALWGGFASVVHADQDSSTFLDGPRGLK